MRLVFAGTPEPAVPSLGVLAAEGHDIVGVVTRPDAPLGRKRVLTPSPVAAAAEKHGLRVIRAARLDDAATDAITALEPELGVIVAYGGLVREPLLSAPTHGWINLHFSLLPRWRGAAPVQHALIAGDELTGASVFQLVAELDAGDVFGERSYRVPRDATAGEVLVDLAGLGAELLRDVVAGIESGRMTAAPQVGEPTFAPKLTLDDGRIRWAEPADRVLGRIHGTTPEPGAFTTVNGQRLKVLAARSGAAHIALRPGEIAAAGRDILIGTGTDAIHVDRVQPAGRPAMAAGDWWRGLRTPELRAGE
ncbi:methionyl-tRNA formyltransferase [Microbacterium sp.]|jgi:methionyl-tRNA formyltransferase|uniref:methionyl-tRNA formyltransferase n=1 Tax=Microbacterium sp. TaxID=51671 RepID=UPI0037C97B95